MLTFKEHEEFIAKILPKIPLGAKGLRQSHSRDRRYTEAKCWTIAVKDAFHAVKRKPVYGTIGAKTIDYYATRAGNGKEKRGREWLLDVVLYVEDKGALVAVESEWGSSVDGIKFDFMRLLSFKAPLKILIIDTGRRGIDAVKNRIEGYARGFEQHQPGEVYYLIDYHEGRDKGQHDVYRYETGRACASGRAAKFTFKKIPGLCGDDA